jgi:phospholipid/cholesterol/gamma-HCH transport system substrate-binding protein
MTSTRLNLAIVGGFVLAALVTLVVALAVLAGRTGATDTYYTEYANVSGLKFGSQVVFEGYPVGQVEHIEPIQDGARTRFRIELSVSEGWKIPDDSIARPVSPGVLAPQIISILAGQSASPLRPGAMITPAGGIDMLSSISSAAGNLDELTDTGLLPLLENLNKQVSTLGAILENDLRPMSRDLKIIVGATAQSWPNIARQTDTATAHLAATSARIDQFMSPERIGAVDRLILNVDRTSESLRSASNQLDMLIKSSGDDLVVGLQDFRYLMTTLARYSEPVGHNVDLSARNVRDLTAELRRNPGALLRGAEGPPDPVPPLKPRTEPQ